MTEKLSFSLKRTKKITMQSWNFTQGSTTFVRGFWTSTGEKPFQVAETTRLILGCTNPNSVCNLQEINTSLYLGLARPQLAYYVLFWSPHLKKTNNTNHTQKPLIKGKGERETRESSEENKNYVRVRKSAL